MNPRMLFVAPLFALAAVPALAQDQYPSHSITMIVPFPPGGVADTTGRPTAAALEKVLKQPIAVTNRPGAGGAVGNAAVANAKPDGYTILMAPSSISVVPAADELVAPILSVIPLQLLAYYIGVAKGLDVDKPRNLAKSVTVE